MKASDQLRLATYMNKRAINFGEGSNFETYGQFVPGLGAGISAAQAARDFGRGHILSGIGNTAMAGLGLIPGGGLVGGIGKMVGKGLIAGGAKLFGKGVAKVGLGGMGKTIAGGGSALGKGIANTTAHADFAMNRGLRSTVPGYRSLQTSAPVKWMAQNQGKLQTAAMAPTAIGVGKAITGGEGGGASSFTEQALEGLKGMGEGGPDGGMLGNMMSNMSNQNPAWVRPPETGSLPTQFLSHLAE